jgi:hypothetical protein
MKNNKGLVTTRIGKFIGPLIPIGILLYEFRTLLTIGFMLFVLSIQAGLGIKK